MKGIKVFIVFCLLCFEVYCSRDLTDYEQRRAKLLAMSSHLIVGNKLILDDRETLANNILMQFKQADSRNILHRLNFSRPYVVYRDDMRKTKMYQTIRRMPKGAALHIHSTLLLDPDNLMTYTYEDNLYACLTNDHLKFRFSDKIPTLPCYAPWKLLSELRKNLSDVTSFDATIKQRLTLGPEDRIGPTFKTNEAWIDFQRTISTILSLIEYRPVREKFWYQSLQNLYDDNIMYAELRIGLYNLYELNGSVHDKFYSAVLFNQTLNKFMTTYPDFGGVKFILTVSRRADKERVQEEITLARKLKAVLPNIFAGFDLVGQEDKGNPLKEYLPLLLEAKKEMDFFFHAGETNSYGTEADENLYDALLLGAKRIGHGLALMKHPAILKVVIEKDIAVEVNVISNSMLSLVQDLRNHPLATFLAFGVPVVLSSDDPGVWGAKPLSDDFYVAFMAVASEHSDLRLLKQLAINSIRYSSVDNIAKVRLYTIFLKKWREFVDYLINSGTVPHQPLN